MPVETPYQRHDKPVMGTWCDPAIRRRFPGVDLHAECPQAPLHRPAGPGQCTCGCHQIDEAGTPPLPIGELEDHQ
jgi:hypothetical protein